jgi:hypothetical protein
MGELYLQTYCYIQSYQMVRAYSKDHTAMYPTGQLSWEVQEAQIGNCKITG